MEKRLARVEEQLDQAATKPWMLAGVAATTGTAAVLARDLLKLFVN